jgi:hypothetical protein
MDNDDAAGGADGVEEVIAEDMPEDVGGSRVDMYDFGHNYDRSH